MSGAAPAGAPPGVSSVSFGRTLDGGQWIVRAQRWTDRAPIVLRVRHLPADDGVDVPISAPGRTSFIPAAATDATGRLHVIWYDSSGPSGGPLYARSLSADLAAGVAAA